MMQKKLYTVYLNKNSQRIIEGLLECGTYEHASAIVDDALTRLEEKLEKEESRKAWENHKKLGE